MQQPYGPGAPLLIKDVPASAMDHIPFFRMAEAYLDMIGRAGTVRLTPSGFLPKKIVTALYDLGYIHDEEIGAKTRKLKNEEDSSAISTIRFCTEFAGLTKKRKGNLSLTRKAQQAMREGQRPALFKMILLAFTEEFNWSMHDGYPDYPIAQHGWMYSIFMLLHEGQVYRPGEAYATGYISLFPEYLEFFEDDAIMGTRQEQLTRCYILRTFERFTQWFGFTEADSEDPFPDLENVPIRKTNILDRVFEWSLPA
jgi:hypothetical protein